MQFKLAIIIQIRTKNYMIITHLHTYLCIKAKKVKTKASVFLYTLSLTSKYSCLILSRNSNKVQKYYKLSKRYGIKFISRAQDVRIGIEKW